MLPDLTQYLWIAWLVLALLFVIVELLTLEFTFLMVSKRSEFPGEVTLLQTGLDARQEASRHGSVDETVIVG